MNYNLSASNFSQYENFLLLLQSRYEKRKEILTRLTYSTLLSNFLKNRSILLHKSFSNLFPNRNRGGEREGEKVFVDHMRGIHVRHTLRGRERHRRNRVPVNPAGRVR